MIGKITTGVAAGLTAMALGGEAEAGHGDCYVTQGAPRTHVFYEQRAKCQTYKVPHTVTKTPRRLNVTLPCHVDNIWNGFLDFLSCLRVPSKDSCSFTVPLPPKVTYDRCAPACAPACDPYETFNSQGFTITTPTEVPTPLPPAQGQTVDPNTASP